MGGEIQLTDAIDALIATQGVDRRMVGNSFDVGDMTSYMQAFFVILQTNLKTRINPKG